MTEYIDFTRRKARLFKKAYDKAVAEKQETFEFEGKLLLTAYAKHVLEHLQNTMRL